MCYNSCSGFYSSCGCVTVVSGSYVLQLLCFTAFSVFYSTYLVCYSSFIVFTAVLVCYSIFSVFTAVVMSVTSVMLTAIVASFTEIKACFYNNWGGLYSSKTVLQRLRCVLQQF